MRLWMAVFIVLALAGAGSAATVSYNWSFDNNNQSWTNSTTIDVTNSSSGASGSVDMFWNGSDGNPPGSLNASLFSTSNGKTLTEMTMWQSPNFSWNNGTPVSANLSFDFKVVIYNPNGATGPNYFSALLKKPDGSVVLINSTTITAAFNWTRFNLTIGANNFTSGGNFTLMLNASLSAKSTGGATPMVSIGWDKPNITLLTSPPNITAFAPTSPVNDTAGATRTFNITANQTVNVTWYINGTLVQTNVSTISANYTNTSAALGIWNVAATANNTNGSASNQWLWNVTAAQQVTIDVTLSNVPVDFGSVSAGVSNQPALLPLNVTIQSTTNVNVNLTLNGSDFTYSAFSFGVGNLSYSNSSGGTKINMATSFPPPPFANWVNIPKLVITNRSVYFWINIPAGQDAGAYSSNVSVRVEEYI